MSLSITLPGLELSLSRSAAYVQLGRLLCAGLCIGSVAGPFWGTSRFEYGTGFQLWAGPVELNIGKP